jgi:hypothetical protein
MDSSGQQCGFTATGKGTEGQRDEFRFCSHALGEVCMACFLNYIYITLTHIICIYTYIQTYIHMYIIRIYIYTYVRVCVCVCVCMRACVRVCVYVCVCTHTHTHTHKHTHKEHKACILSWSAGESLRKQGTCARVNFANAHFQLLEKRVVDAQGALVDVEVHGSVGFRVYG